MGLITAIVESLTRGPITIKTLAVMLVVGVAAGLGVVGYEIETANFALEKYARAAGVLKDLDAVSSSKDSRIGSAADVIVGRVEDILAETRPDPSLSESQHRMALALILGLPWAVLSIAGIVEAVRREPDWQYGLFGCLFLAALLGSVAYYVPTDIHWFYRYLLIPLVVYSALLGMLFVAGDDEAEKEG